MRRAHRLTRRSVRGCAAVLVVGLLAGCSHTVAVPGSRLVRVVVTEYRMQPDRISAPNGPLTIVVRNLGRLNHNLAVLRGQQVVAETKPLAPGARMELSVDLSPGTYLIDSTLFSDQALGLYGTLIVNP